MASRVQVAQLGNRDETPATHKRLRDSEVALSELSTCRRVPEMGNVITFASLPLRRDRDAKDSARFFWAAFAGNQVGGCKDHFFSGPDRHFCVLVTDILENGDGLGCMVNHVHYSSLVASRHQPQVQSDRLEFRFQPRNLTTEMH